MTDPDFLQIPPMKFLETDRLRLRTVRVSDAVAIMPMITDAMTMKYTSGVVPHDRGAAERWLSARALGRDVLNFVLILKKDGVASGNEDEEEEEEEIVGIMGSYHWPEIGYLMNPAHAGKGYATEALHAFLSAWWSNIPSPTPSSPGFDYIQAETDAENLASQKILTKNGFELVETLVGAFDSPTLGIRDTLVFRKARPGLTLEGLGLVEGPPRLLEVQGNGRGVVVGGGSGKADGEEFVPPVQ